MEPPSWLNGFPPSVEIKSVIARSAGQHVTHSAIGSLKFNKDYTTDTDRALDKREYLVIIGDNFCKFFIKTYVVTPHLNRLDKTVQMRGHNIQF